MARLQFVLDGRDQLSRVLDGAGDSATRMARRLLAASIQGDAAMRRLGNSTTQSMAGLQREQNLAAKATKAFKGALISLAPAAIPLVASLAPIAPAVGAAAVATLAYGAALGPQIAAMGEASQAEKAYTEAVAKSGRTSQEAITAQVEYARVTAAMPPETRRAAAAMSVMKDEYGAWSDELAKDTLSPVTKSLAIFGGLLPKTTGLVKGTSAEFDRMTTIVAGGMESPGFDRLNTKFERFATGTLRKVNDGLVNLMRTGDAGKVGGGFTEFMEYARANGPAAAETVRNVGRALMNLLVAGSEVGVGMLDVVNVLTGIVAAVPPGAIATLLQLAIAIKVVGLASVGLVAARTAVAAFGVQLIAMQAAAGAAPGRMAAVTAAWGAMSRGARLAAAGTGVGLLVIAMMELSKVGKSAPPDIDKLTVSLGQFAQSGKVAGEAARVFGTDLSGLMTSLNAMPQKGEDVDAFFKRFKENPTSLKDAKIDVEALDKGLSALVSGGKAELAAASLAEIKTRMEAGGYSTKGMTTNLTEYQAALDAAKFEQDLTAASMGLFGAQAQSVQGKLDAQKRSTDGLRQSIIALNEVNRAALDGRAGMEAAIDAAAAAATKHSEALRITNGELNLNSAEARDAQAALTDLARKTEGSVTAARDSGKSWEYAKGQYDRGRAALIRSADAMGLNRDQAITLADQILKTPDKTAYLKGDVQDLQAKLADAKGRLAKAPKSQTTAIKAEISDLQRKLGAAQRAVDALHGKTITVTTRHVVVGDSSAARNSGSHGSQLKYAGGGLIDGPGTSTSDSIDVKASRGEFMVKAKSVAKYGVSFLKAVNDGTLNLRAASSGVSSGGRGSLAGAGAEAGRGLSAGLRGSAAGVDASARVMAGAVLTGIRAELEIASPSKKTKALAADAGKGMLIGLTGTKAQISAVAKDLVKDIWAAWKGTNSTKDSRLVAMVTRDTRKLQNLATARDKLASKIATARKYAVDLAANARQGAELQNLGIDEEKVSAGTIQAGLSEKLAKIKQFTVYIAALSKKGLSKELLRQVLAMGPESGYAYASALMGMGNSALRQINITSAQVSAASTSLGVWGADSMYDAGSQAGKGFLSGLQAQESAIEAQMMRIAKAMQKAIKKALGIKSPSTVMAALGRHTTEGLAVGMRERLPVLDQAIGAVTDRVASARPVIGRPAVAGAGGGGVVYNIAVTVEQAMDPIAVAREFQKVLVKYGRTQGATVNFKVGG